MLISRNWLRKFLPDLTMTAKEIGEKIMTHTAETEGIEHTADRYKHVYVGKLLGFEKLGEKLHIGQFDIGKMGKKQIVYGSVHELEVGKRYSVALAGAKLHSGLEINKTEIQGAKSEGMVCDMSELGMKCPAMLDLNDVEVGMELASHVDFADALIDIDNKSLTHRPDLMGHDGFGTELALYGNTEKKKPVGLDYKVTNERKVSVETEKCRRFMAVEVQNVVVGQAPRAERILLEHCGTRSINSVVDVTNMTLLGVGQPMHAFDADKINGEIVVRQAKEGEKLLALDEVEYELTEEDVVIADEEKVLSIAGVMGGLASGVTNKTTRIVFECASFDPFSIRKTSQRLGLRSESSMRYEKNLCPEQCDVALGFALQTIADWHENVEILGVTDVFSQKTPEKIIKLSPKKAKRISGMEITPEMMEKSLTGLGFVIISQENDAKWEVKVPANRATKDIEREEDLIEEIVRSVGYGGVPAIMPKVNATPNTPNKLRRTSHSVRYCLKEMGLNEIMTHSLTDKGELAVENPISSHFTHLRSNMVEPVVANLESVLRKERNVAFFELGRTYHAPLGKEKEKLVVVLGSMEESLAVLTKKLKEVVGKLAKSQQVGLKLTQGMDNVPEWVHPHVVGSIMHENKVVGGIGGFHPAKSGIKKANIVWMEVEMEVFMQKEARKYAPPKGKRVIMRDVSIFVEEKVLWEDIKENIETEKVTASLKMVTQDKKFVPEGQKNVVMTVTIIEKEKKLDEEAIKGMMEEIYKTLGEKHYAKIRE